VKSGDGLVDGLDILARFMDPLLSNDGSSAETVPLSPRLMNLYSYTPGNDAIRLSSVAARGFSAISRDLREETLTGRVLLVGPAVALALNSARMNQVRQASRIALSQLLSYGRERLEVVGMTGSNVLIDQLGQIVKPQGGERGHARGGSESQSYWRGESMGAQEIPVIVLHVQISGSGGGPVTEAPEQVWKRLVREVGKTSTQNRPLTFGDGGGGGGTQQIAGGLSSSGLEHTSFRLVVAPVTIIKGGIATVRPLVLL